MNFPWPRRLFPVSFILISMTVVSYFLYYSGTLVDELAVQERARMQIWADATRQIINTDDTVSSPATLEFLLSIIEDNRTIPLLLTDDEGTIIMQRNFALPQPIDSLAPWELSDANKRYLQSKLDRLRQSPNVIHIDISEGNVQHLYYEDSRLLKTLNIYPYILVLVMVIFIAILYLPLRASTKAEQNRLWVGLPQETAHQLGTPISSLMAWLPLLEAEGVDHDTVKEMDKDVNRLSTIASRFSKIGSKPNMEPSDLNAVVGQSVDYMKSRISRRITLTFMQSSVPINANLSAPLLEWVMENLIKNAVDAMDGQGSITVEVKSTTDNAIIMVSDTGKGMTRKQRRDIFKPGYSTKKRGWGLGLTLVRRIVTQYHGGKIYVSDSQPGIGTTFVIELPINPALSTTDA